VPLISAVELPLAESQRRRLKDVLEYQKNRQTFFEVIMISLFIREC
jgi:hypothetical protein